MTNLKDISLLQIWFYLSIIGIIATLSIVYIANIYLGYNLHLGEDPKLFANDLTRPFFIVQDKFSYQSIKKFIPSEPFAYGPLSLFIYKFFTLFSVGTAIILQYTIFILGFLFLSYKFLKQKHNINIIQLIFIFLGSFFVAYILDRGNLDMLTFIIILSALYCYYYKNLPKTFGLLIATAAAIKFYPIVFLLILVNDKQYKILLISIINFIILFLLPFVFLSGGFKLNFHIFLQELTDSQRYFQFTNFSFTILYKSVIQHFTSKAQILTNWHFHYKIYTGIITIISLLMLVLTYLKKLDTWKIITIISIFIAFTPQMSALYKGLNLLFPLYFLINEERSTKTDIIFIGFTISISLIPTMLAILTDSQLKITISLYFANGTFIYLIITEYFSIFKQWKQKKIS